MAKLSKSVAKRLKAVLKQRDKSAEKLALEIGMSTGFIYEFLNGKKDVSLTTLERIAEGLDVSPRDLMPE